MNKEEQKLLYSFKITTNRLANMWGADPTAFSFNEHYIIFENEKWSFVNMVKWHSSEECAEAMAEAKHDIILIPIDLDIIKRNKLFWNYGVWTKEYVPIDCYI